MPRTTLYDYDRIAVQRRSGVPWKVIAAEEGCNEETLRGNFSRWQATDPTNRSVERPVIPEKWPFPVRPVQLELPPRVAGPAPKDDGLFRVIHIPDIHVPFHDGQALGVLYNFLENNSLDGVVLHGDLVDCYPISAYDKDRSHRISQQQELDLAAMVLGRITQLTPNAQFRDYYEGNHEHRLTRMLNRMASDRSIGSILDLRLVQQALSWPVLLGLDELGWKYHTKRGILWNKLVVKHGDIVRQEAAYTARAELYRAAKSGASGHTHRLGRYTRRNDYGVHGWWELGCLCDLDPAYTPSPNWQHGFGISTWDLSDPDHARFQMDLVDIHDGAAIIHGTRYSSPDSEEI